MKSLKFNLRTTIKAIKKGEILIFPTDTVYGLVCDAKNGKAVRRLFKVKQRSLRNPIPIFVKDIKTAKRLAKVSKTQEEFLKKVWPGRVTVILNRKETRIRLWGVDKKTIALRIPNFRPVNFLLEKLNVPLVGTSANISGQPPSGNIKKVLKQFKGKYQPDLIIDGGKLAGSPSKIFDLTSSPPKILRT